MMQETVPEVFLIAEPKIDGDEMKRYLDVVGGLDWFDRVWQERVDGGASDAELLVEFAGRGCYRSWAPGLNANVTKVREDSGEYLRNILSVGHGSVLEHAQFTFVFHNVSRVFTHELVRHRVGVAISQESLRYVRLTDLGFRIPEILNIESDSTDPAHLPMRDQIIDLVEHLESFQRSAADAFGLDDEGVPFHYKKEVTSALRRLAPIGLSTMMTWSANLRTLRHVIEMRTAAGAEEEIRIVFDQVARVMKERYPMLFADFFPADSGTGVPVWTTPNSKV